MGTITDYLGSDHKFCDDVFAALERNISAGLWDAAARPMQEFAGAMQRHFAMEEEVLFPAFEQATGSSAGPTAVMRDEHRQMCAIIDQLREALGWQDVAECLGITETLSIMLQQHNMKEEGILYPMTDRVLSGNLDAILAAMNAMNLTA